MRRSGAFSLNRLFDRAGEAGRLFGLRLEGVWMHVGTPEAIAAAEAAIPESAAQLYVVPRCRRPESHLRIGHRFDARVDRSHCDDR